MEKFKITIEKIYFISILITCISSGKVVGKVKSEHAFESKKTAIIFELDSVLFEESKRGYIKKIGLGNLARYKMSCWADPGEACLDMLEQISKNEQRSPEVPIIRKGRKMPCCIHDLHCGKKNHTEVRSELAQHIEQLDKKNYFKSSHQKEVQKQIIDISLDPEQLADLTQLNKPMISLVQKLKQNGYKLYVLSNLSNAQYQQLTNKHPDIVKLFDDIIISAHVKKVKPDKGIYAYLLKKHTLTPESCIIIDNQEESIAAAKQLGIFGILFDNKYRETIKKLQELGISC